MNVNCEYCANQYYEGELLLLEKEISDFSKRKRNKKEKKKMPIFWQSWYKTTGKRMSYQSVPVSTSSTTLGGVKE